MPFTACEDCESNLDVEQHEPRCPQNKAFRAPTIHLNGSDPKRLLREARRTAKACHEALWALLEMDVNARDFYPQGPDAYREAMDQHCARIAALRTVCAEVDAWAERLDGQWEVIRANRPTATKED
jgi:hypothetical protein